MLLMTCGCSKSIDPHAIAPISLVESVSDLPDDKVWIHPSARRLLAWAGAEVPEAAGAGDDAAALDPSAWRRLDQSHHYQAVVVAGNWSEIGPLLLHLRTSPDFYVDRIDPWGVVFRRGVKEPWSPPDLSTFVASEPAERHAEILSRIAMILQAMGESRAAHRAITAASEQAPDDANVLSRRATIDLQRGKFSEAVALADRVLKEAPDHVPALQIKAQALSKGGAADQAWQVAEQLVRVAPQNDMLSLVLHAQLANQARAYAREQDSLEAVIRISERAGVEPVLYRVLLGQCYARLGLGRQAMEQFRKVESVDSLPEGARKDVKTAIEKLQRSGF